EANAQADVRGLAAYYLAMSLTQQAQRLEADRPAAVGPLRQEAERQLERVINDYAAGPLGKNTLGEVARTALQEVRYLSSGRQAQDVEGEDLDGKKLKLSDYRGKVVVLDFWANWCGFCRQMYPQERDLVERYKDQPFALLGVNCDEDKAQVRRE